MGGRPMVMPAAALAAGMVVSIWLPLPASSWCIALLLTLPACVTFGLSCRFWVFLMLLFLGAALLQFRTEIRSDDDLRLAVSETSIGHIRAIISDPPALRILESDRGSLQRSIVRLQAISWRTNDQWHTVRGGIVATVAGDAERWLHRGDTVEIDGVLRPPANSRAPGLFDYGHFLAWQGIHREIVTQSSNDWKIVKPASNLPWLDRSAQWSRATLTRGLPDDENTRLLLAMVLGWQTGLTAEVSEPFIRTSTLHIFAISGAHVALLAGMILIVLRGFGFADHRSAWIPLLLMWFYTGLTGWQPSAVRSAVMASVYLGGLLLKRPSNLGNSIALAAFLLLIYDPRQLFGASFQLSFIAVVTFATLLAWYRRFERGEHWKPLMEGQNPRAWQIRAWDQIDRLTLRRWYAGDPFSLRKPRSAGPRFMRGTMAGLAISLAVMLLTAPLTAFYFHYFSPIGVFSNLIIGPISALPLGASFASLAFGWLPWIPEILNNIAWWLMWSMNTACQAWSPLPFAAWHAAAPALWLMALYYFGVIGITCFYSTRASLGSNRSIRLLPFFATAALASLLMMVFAPTPHRLVILPGVAGTTLVQTHHRRETHLINPGDRYSAERLVVPFLHAQGFDDLPAFLLTQADAAHVGGTSRVLEKIPVKAVGAPETRSRSRVFKEVVNQLQNTSIAWQPLAQGQSWKGWTILHPSPEETAVKAADAPLVLQMDFGGWKILYVSALSRNGQHALLENNPALESDILIAGLLPNDEALNQEFLDHIHPRLLIVATDPYLPRARGSRATRERLAHAAPEVYFTADVGAVTITLKQNSLITETTEGAALRLTK